MSFKNKRHLIQKSKNFKIKIIEFYYHTAINKINERISRNSIEW